MAQPTSSPPSFSPRRKWSIAVNVTLATIAVFLTLAAINYLSSQWFFKRVYLSSGTRAELSPRTISLLDSLTNNVQVIVYYDTTDPLYTDISELLKEYKAHTQKLSVRTVDYYLDPGAAQDIKVKYDLGSATNRDFIIFDCAGKKAFVDGSRLAQYKIDLEPSTNQDDPKLYAHRKQVAFNGELHFSSAVFAVTQAKPLKAYFLQGHGERSPYDPDKVEGYSKLADIFHRNYIITDTLNTLLGTNDIPLDCNLLVIAGPRQEFQKTELNKISQYLDQGGRLFALFDIYSTNRQIGLENVLAKWNVMVSHSVVRDPDKSPAGTDGTYFALPIQVTHSVTKSIVGSSLEIVLPRPIERIKAPSSSAVDEPLVTELAFSSTNSVLTDSAGEPRPYPLITAVERNGAKGVATERGTTRMLIAGDSLFLDNQVIDNPPNQDFADSAVNWLLDRTVLLAGVGSRPVNEYRLLMARKQIGEVKGILLGAIPGGILLVGGLVWLRRRK